MPSPAATPPRKENLLLNLACTVAAPAIILSKLSDRLGARNALLVALAFPLAYGIYDLIKRRNFNFIAALGFTSTLATGGLGLLRLDPFWFAVKEAAVPTLIGLTVLVSQWTKKPLVRTMMFNDQVINVPKVEEALDRRDQRPAFRELLKTSSWLLAGSFALSAVLNFVLARIIITAMPETPLFNEQLGRLTWVSYIVIMVPSMAVMIYALWRLFKGLQVLTGLTLDEILHQPAEKK
ncbi:intracellular septation protein A [Lacunisphaera limnophila]|uniref:Intracellular septation protein A n=1 Tax=Lacunisphaera limnophila TaxID=1838286 RepID=A0A1D8AR91_9BACT|nr:VC0807 family protein [Lacunisphaera limnophila]AOS43400.1 intracellular septation protein A [Lacunisphaera limnophila]